MTRLRRQEGFSLVELMIAITIMLVVLGATLAIFDVFTQNQNVNQKQNDAQDQARNALDLMQKQFRDHAAPAPDQQLGIDKATSYDVVFQTVGATKPAGSQNSRNVQRIRYCLDSSDPNNEHIWSQTQTWTTATTPAVPGTASCPDPSWGNQKDLADHVVNRISGQDRPLFTADSAQISHISEIRMRLFVDFNPGKRPLEQQLSSTAYFRNENQPPIATFTYVVNANGSVVLNATGSYDPENSPITYQWFDGSTPIGQGLAFQWGDGTSGDHTITLTVSDSSGASESTSAVVTIP